MVADLPLWDADPEQFSSWDKMDKGTGLATATLW